MKAYSPLVRFSFSFDKRQSAESIGSIGVTCKPLEVDEPSRATEVNEVLSPPCLEKASPEVATDNKSILESKTVTVQPTLTLLLQKKLFFQIQISEHAQK